MSLMYWFQFVPDRKESMNHIHMPVFRRKEKLQKTEPVYLSAWMVCRVRKGPWHCNPCLLCQSCQPVKITDLAFKLIKLYSPHFCWSEWMNTTFGNQNYWITSQPGRTTGFTYSQSELLNPTFSQLKLLNSPFSHSKFLNSPFSQSKLLNSFSQSKLLNPPFSQSKLLNPPFSQSELLILPIKIWFEWRFM